MIAENKLMDPTRNLELVIGENDLEATRHIWLGVDLLDPARSRDIGMLNGGEELDNPCLRRTSGKLPRCQITPMEVWGVVMPLEQFPEGVRPYRLRGIENPTLPEPVGHVDGIVGGMTGGTRHFRTDNLVMPVFPGDMIANAIGVAEANKRGIVEIEVLRGIEPGGPDAEFQQLFFPDSYTLPLQIRAVREHIEQVAASVADKDAHSVAANMLTSLTQSTEYMMNFIGQETTQVRMRQAPRGSHIYRYSPKARHFAAQLGIKLNDVGAELTAEVEKAVGTVDTALLAQMNADMIAQVGKVVAEALAGVLGTIAANQPAVESVPAEPVTQPSPKPAKQSK